MRSLAAFLVLLLTGGAVAEPAPPAAETGGATIRAYAEPEGEVFVGQLVRIWIEVTTPTWFTKAPRYPELRLEGAIVLLPEQLGVNFSAREGGETRSGQRQRYVVIPQRAGPLTVPPIAVTLGVAVDGKPGDPVTLRTEPVRLDVVLPPGAAGVGQLVTTPRLTVTERYDPLPESPKVGDAVTRTVTLRGEDTFALALPPVTFAPVDGTRLYGARPRLEDSVNRGRYTGTRTESATYLFQRAGEVALPQITVSWWNPESRELESRTLPAKRFTVAPGPAASELQTAREPPTETLGRWAAAGLDWLRRNAALLALSAGGLYLLVLLGRRFGPALTAVWSARRERRRHAERRFFRAFRRACLAGDERRMVRSFWRWLDRLAPADEAATIERLARRAGDRAVPDLATKLARRRHGRGGGPSEVISRSSILRHVARFRRRLLRAAPGADNSDPAALNPRPRTPSAQV